MSLNAWWAREDLNLQPDRYERYAFPGKAGKHLMISVAFDHV